MNKRDRLDLIIGKKLNSFEVTPPEEVWHAVEKSLNLAASVQRRRQQIRKAAWWFSAAAILIVSAVISLPYFFGYNLNVGKAVSIAQSAKEVEYPNSEVPIQISSSNVNIQDITRGGSSTEMNFGKADKMKADNTDHTENGDDNTIKSDADNCVADKSDADADNLCKKSLEEGKNERNIAIKGENNYKIDDFAALDYAESIKSKKHGKYSLSFSSNIAPGANTAVNNGFKMASFGGNSVSAVGISIVERTSDIKYSLPFSIGVQLHIKLSDKLRLGTGVNYSYLRSKYDGLINKKPYSIKQSLHYIGVPVNLYAIFPYNSKFGFYINAGGTIEKGIRAVNDLKSYNDSYHFSNSISGFQYSINGGLGFEYKFNSVTGIYLEPNAVYYFNSDIPASIRTDQPFQFKVELGFRIHL